MLHTTTHDTNLTFLLLGHFLVKVSWYNSSLWLLGHVLRIKKVRYYLVHNSVTNKT